MASQAWTVTRRGPLLLQSFDLGLGSCLLHTPIPAPGISTIKHQMIGI